MSFVSVLKELVELLSVVGPADGICTPVFCKTGMILHTADVIMSPIKPRTTTLCNERRVRRSSVVKRVVTRGKRRTATNRSAERKQAMAITGMSQVPQAQLLLI